MSVMDYLGKPWIKGAEGPDAYDCWGLVRKVEEREFGRVLPRTLGVVEIKKILADWRQTDKPRHGDVVVMNRTGGIHVGVAWQEHSVLHCMEQVGVITSSYVMLNMMGYGDREYYTPCTQ